MDWFIYRSIDWLIDGLIVGWMRWWIDWSIVFTWTFLAAVLIPKATLRHTAANESALATEVDWERVCRTCSHHGDTELSSGLDSRPSRKSLPEIIHQVTFLWDFCYNISSGVNGQTDKEGKQVLNRKTVFKLVHVRGYMAGTSLRAMK